MEKNVFEDYMKLTNGMVPQAYLGAEEQGKAIRRCSILKEVEICYSNSSSFPVSEELPSRNNPRY